MKSIVRRFAIAFAATACVFLLLDAAWLTTMAARLYRPALGHVMRADFDVLAAAIFYAIYLCGVVFFAVSPSLSGRDALLRGAFFGLVAYATYDLTNQATVIGWPWHVTAVDLCWGAFVTAASAWAGYRASHAGGA
ncbi:MAG TPA: DUF2177 family protein [Burkholderiaceae bacterium]|nr:DUF2177 family protein [Burkholderiaceae bacterium]